MNVHLRPQALAKAAQDDAKPTILMCAPDHFGVGYVINPWMAGQIGRTDATRARRQWNDLRCLLETQARIVLVPQTLGLPDMVFTANAGFALDGAVVVSRFALPERQPEQRFFANWFTDRGYALASWPEDVAFEGAGDALFDRARDLIWCGHGWRSSAQAACLIETIFAKQAVSLRLVDPRFYHLDTCLCPLSGGWLMYYPDAFDTASLATIHEIAQPNKRIEVGEADARGFACNAVEIGGRVIMNACSAHLRARLVAAGFTPIVSRLSEFLRAGGAAKCLTLTLADEPSRDSGVAT